MIFDLLTPPQGPRWLGQKKIAVACPIHVKNSITKFGCILSNGLGGDSIKDRPTLLHLDTCWVLTVLEIVAKKA